MKLYKILIIIQRSNGDVFLSRPLIETINKHYKDSKIDLLINDDTLFMAKTLPYIESIKLYSYTWKSMPILKRIKKELNLIRSIYKKYDLSINLTASDRSVLYAILATKNSLSAVEHNSTKSWWKKLFLKNYYFFETNRHMIYNVLAPLKLLNIHSYTYNYAPKNILSFDNIQQKFNLNDQYIVFHPSAQYQFRTYPSESICALIKLLETLNYQVIITGGNDKINKAIKSILDQKAFSSSILNLIGQTSLEELYSIIKHCNIFIGMDTLTTHIAASFEKKLIAIYGPNSATMWAPFDSNLQYAPTKDTPPITVYGNTIVVQSSLPCVPCNKNGCNGSGKSECLYDINPNTIFLEVLKWLK